MIHHRDDLSLLQAQMIHKKRLESMLSELQTQQKPLKRKVLQLEQIQLEEQKDVERLEGRSLAAFFYYVVGKKDAMLTQERKEAYAARVKYDAARRELEAIESDIEETQADITAMGDLEAHFAQLVEQKKAAIKAIGSPFSDELLALEKELFFLGSQARELQEAINAGNTALTHLNEMMNALESAQELSSLDVLGGSLLTDLAKHEKLDEAQAAVEILQIQLQRFNKELSDVTVRSKVQLNIDKMLRFADLFFDNLFTDMAIYDCIKESRIQAENTRDEIATILRSLTDSLEIIRHKQRKTKAEVDALVVRTEVDP